MWRAQEYEHVSEDMSGEGGGLREEACYRAALYASKSVEKTKTKYQSSVKWE